LYTYIICSLGWCLILETPEGKKKKRERERKKERKKKRREKVDYIYVDFIW